MQESTKIFCEKEKKAVKILATLGGYCALSSNVPWADKDWTDSVERNLWTSTVNFWNLSFAAYNKISCIHFFLTDEVLHMYV